MKSGLWTNLVETTTDVDFVMKSCATMTESMVCVS